MLILALDTTTRAGSAAVVRDGAVVCERLGNPSLTHGQRLPSELMLLLEEAAVALADIDLYAVAAGPGSFTGLRVGIATIQGLALAGNRLVVPVSALDALARAAHADNEDAYVATWMDAQRGEVFSALYQPDARTLVAEPASAPPGATLDSWAAHTRRGALRFIGDGAVRYADTILTRLGEHAFVRPDVPPLAGFIGAIATERSAEAVVPHAVVPIYIRRPDAELARARRTGR